MNANTSVEQPTGGSDTNNGIGWKQVLKFVVFMLSLPAAMFIAAGRLDWVMGWVYTGMLFAFTIVSRIIVMRKNPELLAERGRSSERVNVKGWDKVLVLLVALVGPLAIFIVTGLDMRFGWSSQVPLALQLAAWLLVALGSLFATWALVANKFFSAVVRIQEDRGHTVITTGPYQIVRHPGYAGGILSTLATPPALGSLWALIPAIVTVFLSIIRTALEDRTLQEELAGYDDYAKVVRYRLVPGIW